MKTVSFADLFAGAGGFTAGAKLGLANAGRRGRLVAAVNHWAVAISTHAENHPDGPHFCSDVYRLSPREAVPGGELDLLMASPTCTFFSRARGGKPVSRDQRYGRMTPTQVVRWLTELRVRVLLVENVPEFLEWGPVSRTTGKPIREKRGTYFRAWRRRIERLGFRVEHRILNAADFGDATTRSRLFLIARSDGEAIRWPSPTHSRDASPDLLGAGAKRWRPAREVIDWSLEGRSIFTRERPLSPKTLARILAGMERFGWPEPFLVMLRRHMDGKSLDEPLPTVCAGGNQSPLPTLAADGAVSLVVPYHRTAKARATDAPLPTQTTRDRFALVFPVTHADESQRARSVEDPLPTVTAAKRGELAFVAAAFGERDGQRARVHSIEKPAPTLCARGRVQLVEGEPLTIDIRFRMLQPHELAAAMGFEGYRFKGTKEEVTRQIGNAVPVHTAAALVAALFGRTA